ncbi:hypothetical protein XENTR_v10015641 [Xenopus tropicalis]|nr:hypothetical protein XENTR_v10015641 [Xenopus tropicalis]
MNENLYRQNPLCDDRLIDPSPTPSYTEGRLGCVMDSALCRCIALFQMKCQSGSSHKEPSHHKQLYKQFHFEMQKTLQLASWDILVLPPYPHIIPREPPHRHFIAFPTQAT